MAPSALDSNETFLHPGPYFEQMYDAWIKDRTSVHSSWDAYFQNVSRNLPIGQAFALPPPITKGLAPPSPQLPLAPPLTTSNASPQHILPMTPPPAFLDPHTTETNTTPPPHQSTHDTSRVMQLIRGYQTRGHEIAKIEPLGLPTCPPFTTVAKNKPFNLDYQYYGFTEADLDRFFDCRVQGLEGFMSPDRHPRPLRDLIRRIQETYCASLGIEFMHIGDEEKTNFLRQKLETLEKYEFTNELKRKILVRTARSQLFENFCHTKFSTSKRFGLDGCETMIVGMKAITKKAAKENGNSIVIGMSHRGRLNVLVNVMHKPIQQMMSEFQGVTGFGGSEWGNTGDVKYHLGVEFDHLDENSNRYIHMAVLANPSHLETVNPVMVGQARAQQYWSGDRTRLKVLPIMLHGDASFAGQGVVYETLQMSKLPNYTVGGTIHIVVNNQVGFTTDPVDGGSGKYCTDLAKAIDAPVFHVNADDPEVVTFVSELALEYRQKFKSDVFIDLVGYRRYGHNELDMPKFTQPLMYTLVAKHTPVLELYAHQLIDQGVITSQELTDIKKEIIDFYTVEYEKSKTFTPTNINEYLPQWQHMSHPSIHSPPRVTGVPVEHLIELGTKISTLPSSLVPHPTIGKTFKARVEALQTGENIDYGLAEVLAYASLLSDGFHVRIAGQDAQRGTFSHRHAIVHDQCVEHAYNIFEPLKSPQAIEINNSLLSEYGALGFEVG